MKIRIEIEDWGVSREFIDVDEAMWFMKELQTAEDAIIERNKSFVEHDVYYWRDRCNPKIE